ncbi:MAG TPA: twin-arginine translocase TatA/TatE family subunit [Candidatus Limnocylindrales bacterium]|nr:twin-arginine translocase TatA/TatE family subunit [Candidatus Limnocylindrales bacterium]
MPDTLLVLIVVLIVAIVWRGPKNLPRIGEMLGRGVREARREAAATREEFERSSETSANDAETPPAERG